MKKISILLFIFIIIATVLFSALAKPYNFEENKSTSLINKIFEAETKGEIEVNDAEINGLINSALKNKRELLGITIKKANVDFSDDKIKVISQLSFREYVFQVYIEGILELNNENVYYIINKVKLGYLPLPKDFLFSILNNKKPDLITKDGRIEIAKEYFPYNIKQIIQQDDKIKVIFEKKQSMLFKETSNIINDTKNKKVQEKVNKINKIINEKNKTVQNDKRYMTLNQLNYQLTKITSRLNNENQKQIVYIMQSTVNNMIKNPEYDYSKDILKVKAAYNELTPEQKNEFKTILLINISPALIVELRFILGI